MVARRKALEDRMFGAGERKMQLAIRGPVSCEIDGTSATRGIKLTRFLIAFFTRTPLLKRWSLLSFVDRSVS